MTVRPAGGKEAQAISAKGGKLLMVAAEREDRYR
jgi:hypothetical protein